MPIFDPYFNRNNVKAISRKGVICLVNISLIIPAETGLV